MSISFPLTKKFHLSSLITVSFPLYTGVRSLIFSRLSSTPHLISTHARVCSVKLNAGWLSHMILKSLFRFFSLFTNFSNRASMSLSKYLYLLICVSKCKCILVDVYLRKYMCMLMYMLPNPYSHELSNKNNFVVCLPVFMLTYVYIH